jgi:hypothetical protein
MAADQLLPALAKKRNIQSTAELKGELFKVSTTAVPLQLVEEHPFLEWGQGKNILQIFLL